MKKVPIDRERVESITRYVTAHRGKLAERVHDICRDDDGEPLPFILLLPAGDGTHTIANIPTETVAGILRAGAMQLEGEILRKAFEAGIAHALERVLDSAQLAVPEDVSDDGDKVH